MNLSREAIETAIRALRESERRAADEAERLKRREGADAARAFSTDAARDRMARIELERYRDSRITHVG